eukprot:scaffold226024_cov36-Tisochrysis_lutea.AAC.5
MALDIKWIPSSRGPGHQVELNDVNNVETGICGEDSRHVRERCVWAHGHPAAQWQQGEGEGVFALARL